MLSVLYYQYVKKCFRFYPFLLLFVLLLLLVAMFIIILIIVIIIGVMIIMVVICMCFFTYVYLGSSASVLRSAKGCGSVYRCYSGPGTARVDRFP